MSARRPVRTVESATGAILPALGLGTWRMGESAARRAGEADALRLGLDLGMTLIDTAEMYASGGAEEVVGGAIEGRRDEVFLVSKVLPENASRTGTLRAAERSLERMRTDRIDLYLLHWESAHPLANTLEAFDRLRSDGKILHYGVSNFDHDDLTAACRLAGGEDIASNQVLYNLRRRGVEKRLLPWCRERGVVVMAYAPLDQTGLSDDGTLGRVAARHGTAPAAVALAWILRRDGVSVIPKAASADHVRENRAAADLVLTAEDLVELERAFPAPDHDVPLEIL